MGIRYGGIWYRPENLKERWLYNRHEFDELLTQAFPLRRLSEKDLVKLYKMVIGVNVAARHPPKLKTHHEQILAVGLPFAHTPTFTSIPPPYTPMSDIPDDPIEILVRLAKDNEIDPWNINIIEVADKFLEQLESHRSDIRYFGRTLHYAAILLRMKADAIIDEKEGEAEEKEELDHFDIEEYPIPEPRIRRRSKRPVTLDELIFELKKAEEVGVRRVARSKEKGDKPAMTVADILNVAHDERIEENIRELGAILHEKFKQKDVITLDELLDHNTDKIITYISLLFMATRKEIWLEQPELFGELYITRGEPDV